MRNTSQKHAAGFSLLWTTIGIGVLIVIVVGLTGLPTIVNENEANEKTNTAESSSQNVNTEVTEPVVTPTSKVLVAAEVANVAEEFQFSGEILPNWQVEAVPEIEALNIYDPEAGGATTLDQSQIFIRTFTANAFLTLSTVTIHSREELIVAGRPAVQYDIEKKAGVGDFPNQPDWRNTRHMVTDVRVSDDNPSVFYVIAKNPELAMETYERFLATLVIDTQAVSAGLIEPVEQFRDRVTLKSFGQFITPGNSPVQPERFNGYHTAVDVEFPDTEGIRIPVRAIAPGEVIAARTASGYGGVFIIRHELGGETLTALYGHIAPASLPSVGQSVEAGQELGWLGEGGTAETDGERKHLHFAFHSGPSIELRGYVDNESSLGAWMDPLLLF